MKTRVQVALIKLADPRLVRMLLIGLTLALVLLSHTSVSWADTCPGGSGGGCDGG
jgi:hypothetical protein